MLGPRRERCPNWELTLTGELPPIPGGSSSFHTGFQKRALCVALRTHAARYLQLLVPHHHHPPLSVHLCSGRAYASVDGPFGDSPSSIQPSRQLSLRQVCSARLQVFLCSNPGRLRGGPPSSEAQASHVANTAETRSRAPCGDPVAEGVGEANAVPYSNEPSRIAA